MQTAETTPESRVQIRPDFAWDAQDAYLFDIDGTLLRSRDRIHFNSFSESILAVTGLHVSLTGVVLHGGTDTAILREAFELAKVAPEVWEPQSEAILEAMRQIIETQRERMDLWTMPAVHETLAYLAGRGALLGLATGNLAQIGWTKVELVGLREWFHFGGFSDRFPLRADMVADAVAQARALLPDKAQPTICVVGDTPRDIEAARANDIPVIAVATGNYSFEDLARMEPDACVSSLSALMAERGVAGAAASSSKRLSGEME
jgi:phosphoglycolate phosphatase-like HAD superfamily hydrolase